MGAYLPIEPTMSGPNVVGSEYSALVRAGEGGPVVHGDKMTSTPASYMYLANASAMAATSLSYFSLSSLYSSVPFFSFMLVIGAPVGRMGALKNLATLG